MAGRFGGRLLTIDVRVAARWGSNDGRVRKARHATAADRQPRPRDGLVHDLQIVSRNVDDFERCGVTCVELWVD